MVALVSVGGFFGGLWLKANPQPWRKDDLFMLSREVYDHRKGCPHKLAHAKYNPLVIIRKWKYPSMSQQRLGLHDVHFSTSPNPPQKKTGGKSFGPYVPLPKEQATLLRTT